ncbi:hypothetical protein CAPTEDRAFT_170762 [Capitella teleta]|uniref:E3 ubiquitin-protein ligase RNF181 n=1 Tax=Capitella teleta TaxID=283909 RepID=R7TJ77_CAPTE|nr:hypothetical protein CAPTEDRAFT_170762 [Capitella teleta]|eukprot:ELT93759.1 hypothetical protein CAPTEDRAFT_170762 [Capitella teleta]
MSSYYDEHDCSPLADGERPNHMLHLARLLIDGGYASDLDMEFENLFSGEKKAPPASKKVVEDLPKIPVSPADVSKNTQCPICRADFELGETMLQMPCNHHFHSSCINPWLERTNSCPVCRHELPTDDPDYEEYKRHKARKVQRDFELESLHDSMFG